MKIPVTSIDVTILHNHNHSARLRLWYIVHSVLVEFKSVLIKITHNRDTSH